MYTNFKFFLLTLLILTTNVVTAAPELINYQGYLSDNAAQPVTATLPMTFTIYNAISGGTQFWSESQPSVQVNDGLFSVMLGSVNPIPDTLFAGSSRFLEVIVNGNTITPRTQLVSTPYSLRVRSIDQATGGTISGGLVISPEDFSTLGNAITILNDNGNPQMTFTVNSSDIATFTIVEPEDSKSGRAVGSPIMEVNKDGIVMYGLTSSDTTMNLLPNGNIQSIGQIAIGSNTSGGTWSTAFGYSNDASGDSATVSGGYDNIASGFASVIGGGHGNTASGSNSTIGGGFDNNSAGTYSIIAGGTSNTALTQATVGGGTTNNATGLWSTVAGGVQSTASGSAATVGGGGANFATAYASTVPGGAFNNAEGNYSFAAGRQAKAMHAGSFIWADTVASNYASTQTNEVAFRSKNGFTIDADNPLWGLTVDNAGSGYGGAFFGNGSTGVASSALIAQSDGTSPALYAVAVGGTQAATFSGDVSVTGTLSKGAGSFKIDHPLDPENKYLYHSFVESPDMMNIYNGNVITDGNGYAIVNLPDYFEPLNSDFRYQLTVIGTFAQAIVSKEIENSRFEIRTDHPNVKVSWMVTGIRQDAFAQANRIPVVEDKALVDRGKYLHPEVYDQKKSHGIGFIDLYTNGNLKNRETPGGPQYLEIEGH